MKRMANKEVKGGPNPAEKASSPVRRNFSGEVRVVKEESKKARRNSNRKRRKKRKGRGKVQTRGTNKYAWTNGKRKKK